VATVDLFLLGLAALSTLAGLWRGFIKEAFALVVWAFAFAAAFQFSGLLAAEFEPWVEAPSARQGLAFVSVFIVVLIAGALLTWMISQLVEITGLSGTDRLLGAVFGAARGLLLILALIFAAGFTPAPADPWWQESRVVQGLLPLAEWCAGFLPDTVVEYLDFHPESTDLDGDADGNGESGASAPAPGRSPGDGAAAGETPVLEFAA
jgi:membrane protein required for colicin V production